MANRNICGTCRAYGPTCSVRWRIPRSRRCKRGTLQMCRLRMGYDAAIRVRAGWGGAMMPKSAIVLAAGLGTRMRPYNGHVPKPLVAVAGKSLIDYGLDRLAEVGVERAVVNVHHLPAAGERHLSSRQRPRIITSA